MANQLFMPQTKNPWLLTDRDLHPADPVFSGVGQDLTTDHTLKPSHGLDYGAVKPLPAPTAPVASRGVHQLLKGDRDRLSLSSDDGILANQVLATHAAEHQEYNVKPVLAVVEEIMRLAKPLNTDSTALGTLETHVDTTTDKAYQISKHDDKVHHNFTLDDTMYHGSKLDDRTYHGSFHDADMIKLLAFPINKISSEIICKCAAGAEAHAVTMDFLKSLANYSWDAKIVITFAAFAIKYGEFWLLEQNHTKNLLAKNIATLKDFPETMEQATEMRKKFEAVANLLNTLLQLTHCIVEFKELPAQYISHESPEIAAATTYIPTAVYWTIRSLLACASILLNLIGSGHQYMTSTIESWEILSLGHKLTVMLDHLQKQLKICRDLIERKKGEDAYIAFKKLIEGVHMDNMKVFRAMIRSAEGQKPLFNGTQKTNDQLEVLRLKHVLLLISDLDLPHEELNILHMLYNQNTLKQEYEVLWLPILDPTVTMDSLQESQFLNLRNIMPWHSVEHPSWIEPVVIRYIREVWKFMRMPMLVVMDPQGKPSNLDALPMMWIWGSTGFPFTKLRERNLWAESTWNIELLVNSIDPRITNWIRENRIICLYGGEDIDWIRNFTRSVQQIQKDLNIRFEMLYMGKRNPKEKVRRCHEIIVREELSHTFPIKEYYEYIWYFWVRLLSMWNSKKQLGMTLDSDPIMGEILNILTFESSEQGWAVFSRGNYEMAKGKGDVLQPVLDGYKTWKPKIEHPDKFVEVLDGELRGTHLEHHCNRLILPGHVGHISERVVCSECGKTMDMYVMYRCCTD